MNFKLAGTPIAYNDAINLLKANSFLWLITGVAGFIGSNLLEMLLALDQRVVGLDNFSTGHKKNLEEVKSRVSELQWARFVFHEADVCDVESCRNAVSGVDYVLHQAALGSVPRSINDPIATNRANVDGFLNMLVASKDEGVKQFVYAASSSTYGDHPGLPKVEDVIGRPLSPYALAGGLGGLAGGRLGGLAGGRSPGLRVSSTGTDPTIESAGTGSGSGR